MFNATSASPLVRCRVRYIRKELLVLRIFLRLKVLEASADPLRSLKMSTQSECREIAERDQKSLGEFLKAVGKTILEIKEFNKTLMQFLDTQKNQTKDLCNWITRYNILNA
jgi:hypothetical protein